MKVLFNLFSEVVGSVAKLFDPVSTVALGALISPPPQFNQTTIHQLLSHIHSTLVLPTARANPIRFRHSLLVDLLLADERCHELQLRTNEMLVHSDVGT